MKRLLIVTLLLSCPGVFAQGSFESRLQAAHDLETSPGEQPYQAALKSAVGPKINGFIKSCEQTIAVTVAPPFDLVADITRAATLAHVEVRPDSAFSSCFARALSTASFPALPDSFHGDNYPFAMEMHFH